MSNFLLSAKLFNCLKHEALDLTSASKVFDSCQENQRAPFPVTACFESSRLAIVEACKQLALFSCEKILSAQAVKSGRANRLHNGLVNSLNFASPFPIVTNFELC